MKKKKLLFFYSYYILSNFFRWSFSHMHLHVFFSKITSRTPFSILYTYNLQEYIFTLNIFFGKCLRRVPFSCSCISNISSLLLLYCPCSSCCCHNSKIVYGCLILFLYSCLYVYKYV